jgi:hypothetical protein
MFLIRLSPSMRETAGAGAHGTASAMVKAADALWDTRGSHDPTVAAASIQQSRSPRSRKRSDKRGSNARPKSAPLPAQIFTNFKTLAMACVNFIITMPMGLAGAFRPVLGWKTNSPPNPFWFGGFSHTYLAAHAAVADHRVRPQVVLRQPSGSFSDPLVSSPSLPALPRDGSQNRFPTRQGGFCTPGVPSQVPQTRYPSSQWAPPQRLDL